jgi:MoaA/NifB/PqqE/SkfB family radical SAM enzyme
MVTVAPGFIPALFRISAGMSTRPAPSTFVLSRWQFRYSGVCAIRLCRDEGGATMPAVIEDPTSLEETAYRANLRLGEIEFRRQYLSLHSLPRVLGLVLGNGCNIDCPHCYQAKNGDNLLKPAAIGDELRREFRAFYPYLSTLRVQGGEAFTYPDFAALIEDVGDTVRRPILSASTNGTLIDDRWAERIVRTPFRNLTVSIDGGTAATYAGLRRGARLEAVLANVERIQRWKSKLASEMPYLDSFFVVMRSNFRELPQYFELMTAAGVSEISLQTPEINRENSSREPALVRDQVIANVAEVRELYDLLQKLLPLGRRLFRAVRTSGFTSLFREHGLDASFLREHSDGLYPDSEGLTATSSSDGPPTAPAEDRISLCPNPWTTLFVAENGDVHLCFLAEPIGNLYQAPLISIWNSPAALAKRSRVISGRYVASGCSPRWCSWRDGKKAVMAASAEIQSGIAEMRQLASRAAAMLPPIQIDNDTSGLSAVRRQMSEHERSIHELQTIVEQLCETNGQIHEKGQRHISRLEANESAAAAHIAHLEAKAGKAVADFEALAQEWRRFRSRRFIRLALAVARIGRFLARRFKAGSA